MQISKARSESRLRITKLRLAFLEAIGEADKTSDLSDAEVIKALLETADNIQNNIIIAESP